MPGVSIYECQPISERLLEQWTRKSTNVHTLIRSFVHIPYNTGTPDQTRPDTNAISSSFYLSRSLSVFPLKNTLFVLPTLPKSPNSVPLFLTYDPLAVSLASARLPAPDPSPR